MVQVKIKLSHSEVGVIQHIMKSAAELPLRADMANETIILAEHYLTWLKKYLSADRSKLKTYTVALSLVRILWTRLQQTSYSDGQSLLNKVDQALTNASMKPSSIKPLTRKILL